MKVKLIFAFFVLMALMGCATEFIPFHSTADIPYHQKTKKTEMVFIAGDEELLKAREYGIFACKDSVENYYLLIASQWSSKSSSIVPFKRYEIHHPALLKPTHAIEMHRVCGIAIATWNNEIPKGEALYYEYMSAPEQNINPVSDNVAEWNPSLHFWYQHGEDGPICRWVIGEGSIKQTLDFEDLASVKDLSNLISLGYEQLKKFGYSD